MNSISITWNGHSCFTVEKMGFPLFLIHMAQIRYRDSRRFPSPQTWYSAATNIVTTGTRTQ